MKAKLARAASHIEEGLSRVARSFERLGPDESKALCEQWWSAFLPGFADEAPIRFAVEYLKTHVTKALKAEGLYARQEDRDFLLVTHSMLPVFRFSADAPPPDVGELIPRAMMMGGFTWNAVCDEAMSWTFINEDEGPFFLRRLGPIDEDDVWAASHRPYSRAQREKHRRRI